MKRRRLAAYTTPKKEIARPVYLAVSGPGLAAVP